MGYFVANSNLNNSEYEEMLKSIQNLPDVVLVKKVLISGATKKETRPTLGKLVEISIGEWYGVSRSGGMAM
jgi:hypothetical protein